jgi:hypothetical protein
MCCAIAYLRYRRLFIGSYSTVNGQSKRVEWLMATENQTMVCMVRPMVSYNNRHFVRLRQF